MEERGTVVGREDVRALLLLEEEVGYLVVLGVEVWGEVHVVEGLAGGQEGGLVEDQVVDLEEGQEAGDEALGPSCLQAYQEASRMEEHLVGGQEVGQRVDLEVSLEELGVDPVVGVQSLVDLANVVDLVVLQPQQEGEDADWV